MKVCLNYGFSCKFKEHEIHQTKERNKPLLLFTENLLTLEIYFEKFNFKSKHRKEKKKKKRFMARRVGA